MQTNSSSREAFIFPSVKALEAAGQHAPYQRVMPGKWSLAILGKSIHSILGSELIFVTGLVKFVPVVPGFRVI